MVRPERQVRGSRVNSAVLDEEKVYRLRRYRLSGMTIRELVLEFGIHKNTVRKICKNKTWKHVALGEECRAYISPHDLNRAQYSIKAEYDIQI